MVIDTVYVYSGIVRYILFLLSDKLSFRYAKLCCFMTNESNQFKQRSKASFLICILECHYTVITNVTVWLFWLRSESDIKQCLQRIATEASHSWRSVLQVCNFEKKKKSHYLKKPLCTLSLCSLHLMSHFHHVPLWLAQLLSGDETNDVTGWEDNY